MPTSNRNARKKEQKEKAAAEVARRWAEWQQTHADALRLLAIPSVYLKREEYWHDFLTHGHLHLHADTDEDDSARAYDVSRLAPEQARAFFALIQDDYPDGWSHLDHVIHRVHEILQRAA
jgi:hypothetical protein